MVEWCADYYLRKIAKILKEAVGLRLSNYVDIVDSIAEIGRIQGLHSIYNQIKYFKKQFDTVLLKNDSFGSVVHHQKRSQDGVLRSYLDEAHFQNHPHLPKDQMQNYSNFSMMKRHRRFKWIYVFFSKQIRNVIFYERRCLSC